MDTFVNYLSLGMIRSIVVYFKHVKQGQIPDSSFGTNQIYALNPSLYHCKHDPNFSIDLL